MAPQPASARREFPVWLTDADRALMPACPEAVPLDMLRGNEARVARNHKGATLTALAREGGLDPVEILAVLDDRPFPTREAKADSAGLKQRAAAELLRRVVRFTGGKAANAVELRPALAFVCTLCHAENVVPVQPVAAVTCRFCSTTYATARPPAAASSRDDDARPPADAPAGPAAPPPNESDGPGGEGSEARADTAAAGR